MQLLINMNLSISSNSSTNFNGIERFRPTKVDNKLMRGASVLSPFKMRTIKNNGVTQIIDLRNSAYIERPLEKLMCRLFGIKYVNYKFSHRKTDIPNKEFFERINNAITGNQGKTYVHCQYGRHRTGLAVAVYEKAHTKKTNAEIIQNMINNGYCEIISEGKTQKEKKYINQFKQMWDSFFKS